MKNDIDFKTYLLKYSTARFLRTSPRSHACERVRPSSNFVDGVRQCATAVDRSRPQWTASVWTLLKFINATFLYSSNSSLYDGNVATVGNSYLQNYSSVTLLTHLPTLSAPHLYPEFNPLTHPHSCTPVFYQMPRTTTLQPHALRSNLWQWGDAKWILHAPELFAQSRHCTVAATALQCSQSISNVSIYNYQ